MPESSSLRRRVTIWRRFRPPRQSLIRFTASVALALLAAYGLYLLQPGWFSVPIDTPPNNAPLPSPTPTPRPKPPPPLPYLGEHEIVDNVEITPLSVAYTHGTGNKLATKGNIFVVVMIRYVNRTGHDYPLTPNLSCSLSLCNYYVLDGQGEKNPPLDIDPLQTGLRPVVLQDGGHQEGSYTFEVPERDADAHVLQLLYYHEPLTDANNVKHWILQYPPKNEY